MEILAGDGAVCRYFLLPLLRFGQIQQPENLVGSRHAVHGNVEVGTKHPHGQEEIRRQQDNKQTARQIHVPRPQLGSRQNHPQSSASIGNDIHDGDGIELHGQHLHGYLAEMLALLVHFPVLHFVRLINLGGGQPLQIFQEGITQSGILPPIAVEQFLRPPLNHHNGHRNEGHAHQQYGGAGQIYKAQHRKQGQRGQHGIKELGQIRAEVSFQLLHALHRNLHHFRGIHLLPVGAAQPQELPINHLPQGFLHRLGGQEAHPAGRSGAGIPHRNRCHANGSRHGRLPAPGCPMVQSLKQQSNRRHHHNVGAQRNPLEEYVPGNVFLAFFDCANQSFVHHHRHPRI